MSTNPARTYDNSRREQQAGENRARILEAAAGLLGSQDGELTVPAIARAAGVSVPTVYRNFATREALLEAVDRYVTESLGAPRSPFGTVDDYLRDLPAVYEYFHRNQAFIRASIRARNVIEVVQHGMRARDRAVAKMLAPETTHLSSEDARTLMAFMRMFSGAETTLAMFERWDLGPAQMARTMRWLIGLMLADLRKGGGPGLTRPPKQRAKRSAGTGKASRAKPNEEG